MIRPRALKEETKKDLKHWGIELVVVVIGVLLALWAQAWFENRSEKRDVALSEKAVREEIAHNIATLEVWDALGKCHKEQLELLKQELLSSDGRWTGISRASVRVQPEQSPVGNFLEFTMMDPRDSAWHSAVSSGATEKMDQDMVEQYRYAYFVFENFKKSTEESLDHRSAIMALAYPTTLSAAERREMLNHILILEARRASIERSASFQREAFLDMDWVPDELAAIDEKLSDWAGVVDQAFTPTKPCYRAPSNSMRADKAQ